MLKNWRLRHQLFGLATVFILMMSAGGTLALALMHRQAQTAHALHEEDIAALRELKASGQDESVHTQVERMIEQRLDRSRAREVDVAQSFQVAAWTLGLLSLGAVAMGAALTWLITRRVMRELGGEPRDVRALAEAISHGDLSVAPVVTPEDRTSTMAALARMTVTLRQMVQSVQGNAEQVAATSAQISQGSTELSARTEEQASALQETAASMEELTSTISQNAENAARASTLAQSASDMAVKGGHAVDAVVSTMERIDQSSKRIGDIISVIDGIAFQTNILALNAAVEAARAGEQGRGFAVVAAEVRNLAQRSATAAKEIGELIGASVEQVGEGGRRVVEAGATMRELVASVQRVSELMGEISAASREQSSGVQQISEAVSQMDQATQQNAALVEESAASAESLDRQAHDLLAAAQRFALGNAASSTAEAAPAAAPPPDSAAVRVMPQANALASPRLALAMPGGANDDWESF